ncbi:Putative protein of unknown function [Podospora comata]|uniref:Uncharacterized protein n=1 Tax=Podospora comata TaxID=48703 RepID=A0ABY6RTD3_PODCO|nr:Putative protein of unknown function [Podospora comata]
MSDSIKRRSKSNAKKPHVVNGQSWRSNGPQTQSVRSVLNRDSTTDSVKDQQPSSPSGSAQEPSKEQMHELRQYIELLFQLQNWYLTGNDAAQSSGGHVKSNVLSPVEEEVYKLYRLRNRIAFKLHALKMTTAQKGSNNDEPSLSGTAPVKLADILQRKWDAPRLDRKVLHQILAKGGYKPKPKSRVSSGLALTPSDTDFFELCAAIESQMKNTAKTAGPLPPPPPPPPKPKHIQSFETAESIAMGRYVPSLAREKQSITLTPTMTTKTSTLSSMTTKSLPLPPFCSPALADDKAAPAESTKDRTNNWNPVDATPGTPRNSLRQLPPLRHRETPIYIDLPDSNLETKSVLDSQREIEAKAKPIVRLTPNRATPLLQPKVPLTTGFERQFGVGREDDAWSVGETTKRSTPRPSKLRHEIQAEPDTSVIVAHRAAEAKLPLKVKLEPQAELKLMPKAVPAVTGHISAYNPDRRSRFIGSEVPMGNQKKTESTIPPTLEPSPSPTSEPRPPKPTNPPNELNVYSNDRPIDSDSEPEWEVLSTPDFLATYCEHCGIENDDFASLSFDEDSDSDSGVEFDEQEDGVLITNRQLIEGDDDDGTFKRTTEDWEAIEDWGDDFTEEKEDDNGRYVV